MALLRVRLWFLLFTLLALAGCAGFDLSLEEEPTIPEGCFLAPYTNVVICPRKELEAEKYVSVDDLRCLDPVTQDCSHLM